MARKLQPSAITLDLGLADIDGFVLLDLLKHDPETGHIPIHVISGVDRSTSVMGMGAFGVTEKPAERDELVGVFTALREQPRKQKPRGASAKSGDGHGAARPADTGACRGQGPDRRRRHPQHLLADQRSREP